MDLDRTLRELDWPEAAIESLVRAAPIPWTYSVSESERPGRAAREQAARLTIPSFSILHAEAESIALRVDERAIWRGYHEGIWRKSLSDVPWWIDITHPWIEHAIRLGWPEQFTRHELSRWDCHPQFLHIHVTIAAQWIAFTMPLGQSFGIYRRDAREDSEYGTLNPANNDSILLEFHASEEIGPHGETQPLPCPYHRDGAYHLGCPWCRQAPCPAHGPIYHRECSWCGMDPKRTCGCTGEHRSLCVFDGQSIEPRRRIAYVREQWKAVACDDCALAVARTTEAAQQKSMKGWQHSTPCEKHAGRSIIVSPSGYAMWNAGPMIAFGPDYEPDEASSYEVTAGATPDSDTDMPLIGIRRKEGSRWAIRWDRALVDQARIDEARRENLSVNLKPLAENPLASLLDDDDDDDAPDHTPVVTLDTTPIVLPAALHEVVILDTETTGFLKTDRIVQIGASILHLPSGKILDVYDSFVNPEAPIYNSHVHHITNDTVAGSPAIHVVLPQLLQFIGTRICFAHNASFDFRMLAQEAERIKLLLPAIRYGCTLALSKKAWPERKTTGGYALERLAVDLRLTRGTAHRADGDVKTTTHLLFVIAQKKPELLAKAKWKQI